LRASVVDGHAGIDLVARIRLLVAPVAGREEEGGRDENPSIANTHGSPQCCSKERAHFASPAGHVKPTRAASLDRAPARFALESTDVCAFCDALVGRWTVRLSIFRPSRSRRDASSYLGE
jgi:hypothetical protein